VYGSPNTEAGSRVSPGTRFLFGGKLQKTMGGHSSYGTPLQFRSRSVHRVDFPLGEAMVHYTFAPTKKQGKRLPGEVAVAISIRAGNRFGPVQDGRRERIARCSDKAAPHG
jgi:hypothetical protein